MRFGLEILVGSRWTETTERIRAYEQRGFDVIATGDHMRHPFDSDYELLDGWSVLPAWAMATSKVRLSMLVTNIIYRNPMLLARQATAVDHISGGRLDVGVGTGIFDSDHAMAGIPRWEVDERLDRLDEFLRAYAALVAGSESFDGRWYSFSLAALSPRPIQQPRPPLIVAANGRRAIALAAQHGDGWNTWGGYGINEAQFFELAVQRSDLFTKSCLRYGRDPSVPLRSILIHHTAVDAWESSDKFCEVVERSAEAGFSEMVFYEPGPERQESFDEIVEHVLPRFQSVG